MNKKCFSVNVILLSTVLFSSHTLAQSPLSLGLGAKLVGVNWQGENNLETTQDFESDTGGQLGFNLVLQKGRFYSGFNLQGGEYKFKDGSPARIRKIDSQIVPLESDEATIQRSELDVLVGYYFWERISLFLDIKGISNKYKNEDYKMDFAGLGAGISGFIPLSERWILFGSFGFVPVGNVEGNGTKIGDGNSGALEFGAVFKFNQRNRLNFGLKSQWQNYEFDDGSKQEHQLNGLFLGYNHLFLFGSQH